MLLMAVALSKYNGEGVMTQNQYELVIGNKNYSSWSLRPWLLMTRFAIPFDEFHVNLRGERRQEELDANSPSALVPALRHNGLNVWDSLAIIEYLADQHGELPIWPGETQAKAIARSVASEMHSRFFNLRNEMPMDFARMIPTDDISEGVEKDIRRIVAIWHLCRSQYGSGGEFLFGGFSAADAMYAPVASRLRSYGVDLAQFGDDGYGSEYIQAIFEMPEIALWGKASQLEIGSETS